MFFAPFYLVPFLEMIEQLILLIILLKLVMGLNTYIYFKKYSGNSNFHLIASSMNHIH